MEDKLSGNAEVRSSAANEREQLERDGEKTREDATVGLASHGDEQR